MRCALWFGEFAAVVLGLLQSEAAACVLVGMDKDESKLIRERLRKMGGV